MFDIINNKTKVHYTVVYVNKLDSETSTSMQYWAYNHNTKVFEWILDQGDFEMLTNKDIY